MTNTTLFTLFRIGFNTRFYYPVFTVLFLDFGITLEQFGILNTIWALSIVLFEVPSGALADMIGRKNLVVSAALIMLVELLLLVFLPIGASWVFWVLVVNRFLSGLAEAAASGADEALAYDSLPQEGREDAWQEVLSRTMKWSSMGFFLAMLLGGVIYDHELLSKYLPFEWSKEASIRSIIWLTLAMGIMALFSALLMKDESHSKSSETFSLLKCLGLGKQAFERTLESGRWVWRSHAVFCVIVVGLLFDSISRTFITLNSQYLRALEFPEAVFGVFGAAMALISIGIPWIAKKMDRNFSRLKNASIVGLGLLLGFLGISIFESQWSVTLLLFIGSSMSFIGYFSSRYLNADAPADIRATVLSFKGLSFNLAYGSMSLIYSGYVYVVKNPELSQSKNLLTSFSLFPVSMIIGAVLVVLAIGLHARAYTSKSEAK